MNEEENAVLNHDRVLLAWSAPEFIAHPRGKVWFAMASLFIAGIVAYSIWTDSITTAIVFLLLAGVYFLTQNQSPRRIEIKITELGLWVHETFYPYNSLKAFWIVYHTPFVRSLYFQTAGKTTSTLHLQLNAQDPIAVNEVLSKKLPEVEGAQESFTDLCIRLFRL